jgi:hypothetical protein
MAAGTKHLQHPKKGKLRFEYATFQSNDDPALRLVILLRFETWQSAATTNAGRPWAPASSHIAGNPESCRLPGCLWRSGLPARRACGDPSMIVQCRR